MFGPEIGSQVEVRELALEGITGEWDETEGNRIMIMTGVKPDDHITHSVAHSTQVVLEQTDEGADAAIKSEDGITTLRDQLQGVREQRDFIARSFRLK